MIGSGNAATVRDGQCMGWCIWPWMKGKTERHWNMLWRMGTKTSRVTDCCFCSSRSRLRCMKLQGYSRGCVNRKPPSKHHFYTGQSPHVLRYGRCKSKPSSTELRVKLPAQEVSVREEVAQGGKSPPRLWWGRTRSNKTLVGMDPCWLVHHWRSTLTNSNMKVNFWFFFIYVPSWSFCSYQ